MKYIFALSIALGLVGSLPAEVSTNLVIDGSSQDPPLTEPATLGTNSILNYTIDGSGLLSLNHNFSNSGNADVANWGNVLDFTGVSGLSAGVSATFQIRIFAVGSDGADRQIEAKEDLGLGVNGLNGGRLDWGQQTNSESFRFEVTTTSLPSNLQLTISNLVLGNGNAIGGVLPEANIASLSGGVTGYTGNIGSIATATNGISVTIPDGGLSIVGGGGNAATGSFVLSQATKPGSGTVGFSLQGITLDVVAVTIPEPSTVAFYFGLVTLGLVFWRRRRT